MHGYDGDGGWWYSKCEYYDEFDYFDIDNNYDVSYFNINVENHDI